MKKNNKILKYITIAFALFFCCIIFYQASLYLIPTLLFGPSDVDEEDKFVEFADGSTLERTGGPTYEHNLFDNYYFYRGDNSYECRFVCTQNNTVIATDDQWGMVFKYAFDPAGFIAFRFLNREATPKKTMPVLYEFNGDEIVVDKNILYDCNTDTAYEFDSMNMLGDYCKSNSIQLGVWYYPEGFSTNPEQLIVDIDGWQLALNYSDLYETVYNDGQLLFAGSIDKYFVTDKYFAFHFRLIDAYDYEIEENPVVEYKTDTVIGKQIFSDVYADVYIFVNTFTDEYFIFEDKSAVNEYAESLGINYKWTKVKYK